MMVIKCDICGAEMRMATPRYKVVLDGWLRREKDICVSCFQRITDEIKKADTPQTGRYDYNKSEMENIKLGNGISREIPNPDCPWK